MRAQLVNTGNATHSLNGGKLQTGVKTLPGLNKDATDRNRTSPFAFTGNKFEFRMLGSRDSAAAPNVVLNTIVAESLCETCDMLEKAEDFDKAVHDIIKEYATEHQRIVFNGNGYAQEWVEEAERRGLPNLSSMVDAIPALVSEDAIRMFEKFHVFTEAELRSRAEIKYEAYSKAVNIEARTMIDVASKHIIPAVIRYTRTLAETVNAVTQAGAQAEVQLGLLNDTGRLLKEAKEALDILIAETGKASEMGEGEDQARRFREHVVPAMDALRRPVDELEMIVDKEVWPMPSYGDLIFEV